MRLESRPPSVIALPFGVLASRSFQPDPLMVSLSLVALWAIVRHDEAPEPRRFAWHAPAVSLSPSLRSCFSR